MNAMNSFLAICILLVGCQNLPKRQFADGESLKMRVFSHSSYSVVFNSVKNTLFSKGFSIKSIHKESGLITSVISPDEASDYSVRNASVHHYSISRAKIIRQELEVDANVNELSDQAVKVHLLVKHTYFYDDGSSNTKIVETYEPYDEFFARISEEVRSLSPPQKSSLPSLKKK